jgi:hypothetical protein
MIVAAPPVEYHEGCMITREDVAAWVGRYEDAWRSPGTEALHDVFSEDASYRQGPYHQELVGLHTIAAMCGCCAKGVVCPGGLRPFRDGAELHRV